jgi:hypothetical protein
MKYVLITMLFVLKDDNRYDTWCGGKGYKKCVVPALEVGYFCLDTLPGLG